MFSQVNLHLSYEISILINFTKGNIIYSLFNLKSPISQGVIHIPEWEYCKAGLLKNLNQVIHFYRHNPMAVHSDHFLVKLLQSITIPQSQNLERYYTNVDAIALNLSMSLKMTSSIFKGQLFNGIFYGNDNTEILIAIDEDFDFNLAHKEWMNLSPIKVLKHFKSDLNLDLMDGTNSGSETGIAVLTINITELAVMYRAFRLNEIEMNNENPDTQKSIMQFIHMYVLPNILPSHLDHAIFNRMAYLEENIPLGDSERKHPYYLTDFGSKLVYAQNTILNILKKENKDFSGILKNIPLVSCTDASKLMEIPDISLTRQVLWSMVLARLPELLFLCKVSKDSIGNKNQSEINRIVRYFLAYKSDNIFRNTLPYDIWTDINDEIESIKSMVK